MILAARREDTPAGAVEASYGALLGMRKTWGIILGRSLTDPVWFFVADWFAVYLVSKGYNLADTVMGFWIPFLAADLGNFAGGGASSLLVRHGWEVVRARKLVIIICGLGMTLLAAATLAQTLPLLLVFFAISTFCYAAWSTMALSLPADLYPTSQVASVSGMSGTGAGLGTILSTYLIGWAADHYSFEPVLIVASLVPLAATVAVLALVRSPRTMSRSPQVPSR